MTCVVVVVLCDEPEAFALDLSDDQSYYLFSYSKSEIHVQQVLPHVACGAGLLCFLADGRKRHTKPEIAWLRRTVFSVYLLCLGCM